MGSSSLRAGKTDDAKGLFANYTSNEEASRYLQRKPHSSVEDTRSFLQEWGEPSWGDDGRYAWVISVPDRGEAIGVVLLIIHEHGAEIHFGISPNNWGQGYATEAVQAVMKWITDSSAINEVTTVCDCEHASSAKVLLKSGFKQQDMIEAYLFLPAFGSKRNVVRYRWARQPIE